MNNVYITRNYINLSEIIRFIRLEMGLYMLAYGYCALLLFQGSMESIIPLSLIILLSTFGVYSYNKITDKSEDLINNKKLNKFSEGRKGISIIIFCIILSLALSFALPLNAQILYLIAFSCAMLYSPFRLKRYAILSNVYSALTYPLIFIMAALVANAGILEILFFFPIFFLWGFSIKLRGDTDGFEGDKKAGLSSIPVVIGIKNSKKLLGTFMLVTIISIFLFYRMFTLSALVLLPGIFFLTRKKLRITRYTLLSSMIISPLSLMVFL